MAVKYVFVTGGVVSGLGKGITAASLGRLLKARGYKVTMQKFDPYINIDQMELKLTWIWDIMNVLSTKIWTRIPMLPLVKFTGLSSRRNVAATMAAAQFRLFLILPMKSNSGCWTWQKKAALMWSLPKSVVPLAISKASLS